jgi:hypothetical protein
MRWRPEGLDIALIKRTAMDKTEPWMDDPEDILINTTIDAVLQALKEAGNNATNFTCKGIKSTQSGTWVFIPNDKET